mmetsp:Transcript_27383/g.71828  ORF Transcript_27383/g.71828 Transcript_27383/m.71828 type:complete len:507 (-) Transcript_27383:150-1670(-)
MAGVKKIGQYALGETLGTGSFGKVKRAEHVMTGHVVAVKILNREKVKNLDMVGKIKREIQILKLFYHPHIIKLYQVITSPSDIFLMMEYVSGGELFDYILQHGKLEEKDARKFFQQIISGVDYCHRHMVVHRDLKPENLLLDSKNNVKIADFGLSNIMTDGNFLKTSCGSPNYAAPEVISGMLYAGPEVDVWSCGVILYVLLCGKLPFDDDYVPYLFKKIRGGIFTIPDHVSGDATDLVTSMLRVDPLNRITIDGIREHPWFKIDLPEYLFPTADEEEGAEFDDAAVKEVCQRFQVFPEHVLEVLRERDATNQLYVAYRLIMVNRKNAVYGHTIKPEEMEVSSDLFKRAAAAAPSAVSKRRGGTTARKATPKAKTKRPHGQPHKRRARWHLGMRSQNSPFEVMQEVYRAMASLNFQWKVVTPFHARCRCWNQVSGSLVKMSLQLYATTDNQYLLDFMSLPTSSKDALCAIGTSTLKGDDVDQSETSEPHTLEFFELCAMIISELQK